MAKRKTTEQFIQEAEMVHGKGIFDYTLSEYQGANAPVEIVCQHGHHFWQLPHNHLKGHGCKYCMADNLKMTIRGKYMNDCYYTANGYVGDIWTSMINRCEDAKYHKKEPTYKDCTICDEWHLLSAFEKWVKDPANGYREGYAIDKDILFKGNKIYSPQTCCFVPQFINSIFTRRHACRGYLPIGVSVNKGRDGYRSVVTKYGKHVHLGYYNTPEEAFYAYKEAKEKYIKEVAQEYYDRGDITKKVYDAMMRYEVEITD
ncbi:AP2 domain-containing protein [Clavibacter sp.]|uniref:AP2 domain-containing protein n=1 Tax=Clavibacter sp. TaxID=1871044 RepID=UPI0019A58342|nr:AP2 domain-containing protein [Clavibacter sp.]MBD5381963.1 hypothetical protein [Clavibacter sp.]